MPIVEFDGPPSWSLGVSETGESTKCPWVGGEEEGPIFSAPSIDVSCFPYTSFGLYRAFIQQNRTGSRGFLYIC